MPDDHSDLEPLLPIPNRTVKRDRANDSALACVKVGHRQTYPIKPPALIQRQGVWHLEADIEAKYSSSPTLEMRTYLPQQPHRCVLVK